jgi:hypothetical protein
MRMACTALSMVPWAVTRMTAMVSGLFGEPPQQFDSAHARHFEIGDDDRRRPLGGFLQSLGAVPGRLYAKSPGTDQFGQPGSFVLLVFDNQYFFVAHRIVLTRFLTA